MAESILVVDDPKLRLIVVFEPTINKLAVEIQRLFDGEWVTFITHECKTLQVVSR